MNDYNAISLWKDVTPELWNDWHWQIRNRLSSVEQLSQVINLEETEKHIIRDSLNTLRMAVTPYYASLMDQNDPEDPIRIRSVPTMMETMIMPEDMVDPLHEDIDSPAPGLTHRYPDRVLLLVTDQCGDYCRHCTRRRTVGETDRARTKEEIDLGIDYIRKTKGVRDVVISGGDPLTLETGRLEYIISALHSIDHVEMVRLGTAAPVTFPQRITEEFVEMLSKYSPIFLNTHFIHPKEITEEAKAALKLLANAGIVLGNQTPLLRGINDCPYIMKELVQQLTYNRVRPYYIYQCDLSQGISHFRTSVQEGIDISEFLQGHTSGLAIPQFMIDAPGGGGKIPVPRNLVGRDGRIVYVRNFEGDTFQYVEPENLMAPACPQACQICYQRVERGQDMPPVGLQKNFHRGVWQTINARPNP
ncbi:MAG: lysine 2,3-aminomutase [Nanoarchaeota archaeon]|nr:lysine 2,3-aminomutase [Nanoarchaeota archaeon]